MKPSPHFYYVTKKSQLLSSKTILRYLTLVLHPDHSIHNQALSCTARLSVIHCHILTCSHGLLSCLPSSSPCRLRSILHHGGQEAQVHWGVQYRLCRYWSFCGNTKRSVIRSYHHWGHLPGKQASPYLLQSCFSFSRIPYHLPLRPYGIHTYPSTPGIEYEPAHQIFTLPELDLSDAFSVTFPCGIRLTCTLIAMHHPRFYELSDLY